MNAESIYKQTLEQLAAAGNPEAKLALSLGAAAPASDIKPMTRNICDRLNQANRDLGDALGHNDMKWTRNTDRAIERARDQINEALTILATR
jgi:hypothetical protein